MQRVYEMQRILRGSAEIVAFLWLLPMSIFYAPFFCFVCFFTDKSVNEIFPFFLITYNLQLILKRNESIRLLSIIVLLCCSVVVNFLFLFFTFIFTQFRCWQTLYYMMRILLIERRIELYTLLVSSVNTIGKRQCISHTLYNVFINKYQNASKKSEVR